MKTKSIFLSILIVLLLILTACSKNDVDEYLSSLQEASNKATELENGKFSFTNIVEHETGKQTLVTEGTFVKKEDYIDWHTELAMGEGTNRTLTEFIQKDKTQYQRFGRINEDDQFISDDNKVLEEVPEWQIVNENSTDYPDYLQPFMNLQLNQDEINKVEKKEENNLTIFEITYNDSYLSSVKQKNIAEINEQLNKARQEDADPTVISALESSLSNYENINFKSINLILTVDDTGVLIAHELKSSFEQTISGTLQNIQMTEKVEIMKYNGTDVNIEL